MEGVMNQVVGGDTTDAPETETQFPAELKPLLDEAVQHIYGENFEKFARMFEQGPETFPQSMATAINAVLKRLEKDHGELDMDAIGALGAEIFNMLLEDLVAGGVIEDVDSGMVAQAIQKTMSMWLTENNGRVDPNEVGQSLQELAIAMKEGGVLEGAPTAEPQPAPQGQEMMP